MGQTRIGMKFWEHDQDLKEPIGSLAEDMVHELLYNLDRNVLVLESHDGVSALATMTKCY